MQSPSASSSSSSSSCPAIHVKDTANVVLGTAGGEAVTATLTVKKKKTDPSLLQASSVEIADLATLSSSSSLLLSSSSSSSSSEYGENKNTNDKMVKLSNDNEVQLATEVEREKEKEKKTIEMEMGIGEKSWKKNEVNEARMEVEEKSTIHSTSLKSTKKDYDRSSTSSSSQMLEKGKEDTVLPILRSTTDLSSSSSGYNTRYSRDHHETYTSKQGSHTVTRYQVKRGLTPEQEPAHTLRSHREPTAVALAAAAQEKEIMGSPLADELVIRTRSSRSSRSKQEETKKVVSPSK